jgi:hypothetical protein
MVELLFKVSSVFRALFDANVRNNVRQQMREIFVIVLKELLDILRFFWNPD